MTHNEKVLRLLSDHRPHGHMEGYRLGVMLHSRVADLRKQGHVIECWREGDNYLYRLVSSPVLPLVADEVAAETATAVPVSPPPGTAAQQRQLGLFGEWEDAA